MATIKVILKENKKDVKGEMPLYLRIIKDRKAKFISLGYKIKEKDWNEAQGTVRKSHPNAVYLNNFIAHKIAEAQGYSLEMETESKYVEPKEIKQAIMGKASGSFLVYCDVYNENAKSTYAVGTYNRYVAVISKLKTYIGNKDFTFNDLTPKFLKEYENHMRTKLENATNTINSNFKVIRHIINEAINDDLLPYEKNPFLKYKLKTAKTNIDFLTEEELDAFDKLVLVKDSMKFHHRNMYIFAAYAGGLRISDLLTLRWSDFNGERIVKNTKKTDSTVSIKLPTRALEILSYYEAFKTKNSDFIFPILDNNIDYTRSNVLFQAISTATAYTNTDLKDLAKLMELNKSLHFHTSRHTFATRALRKGARIEFVSKLLGHTSIKTTQIYAKIVNEDLDKAMDLFG